MGDFVEQLLAKTATEYAVIFGLNSNQNDAAKNLRQQSTSPLLKGVKGFHDSIHSFDDEGRSEFISELITDNMHEEQIWQQQEVQMEAVKRFLHEKITVTNVEEWTPQFLLGSKNRPVESSVQPSTPPPADTDSEDSEENQGEELEAESEESDAELSEIKKRLKNTDDLFGQLGDGSDDDLFDGAEKEWGEDEDEDEEDNDNDFDFDLPSTKEPKEQKTAKKPSKRKTEVDDKFFKLADMEEFLDREDQKEERKNKRGKEDEGDASDESASEDDSQKMDMFSTWSDEETGKDCMYADFFDPPEDGEETQLAMDMDSEEEEDMQEDSEEDTDSEEDEDGAKSGKKKVRFSDNTKDANKEENVKQSLSTFEKRTEKLRRQIQALEEQSLEERPWQMMGEVEGKDRPENSMLQEHVDFKQAPPSAAEMTEEWSKSIEEIILQRVKDKAFDDNVRQVRPVEEAFELKTERTLDQEKSKLSLHEVYEQEFLKSQAPEEEEKTNPVHDEIKKMMDHLFPRLDALASWHYTPLQAVPELRVKNNLPSLRMEEPTPISMSNAAVLAPEEIQAKKKGELKGKTERTKEDKHRERKQKKAAKRQKTKEKEKRKKEVEKLNPGLGNKYAKQRALKELEKAAAGNIEVIKDREKKGKKTTSSKAFFSQLQQEVTSQTTTKGKKRMKQKSSDKLLL